MKWYIFTHDTTEIDGVIFFYYFKLILSKILAPIFYYSLLQLSNWIFFFLIFSYIDVLTQVNSYVSRCVQSSLIKIVAIFAPFVIPFCKKIFIKYQIAHHKITMQFAYISTIPYFFLLFKLY